jgi:dGTPase
VQTFLRAQTIGKLINQATEVFKKNYEGIINNNYDISLTDQIENAAELNKFGEIMKSKVYCSELVVGTEACGLTVINNLLTSFYEAISEIEQGKPLPPLAKIMPPLMRMKKEKIECMSCYERILEVTDFVSGMTDNFAINLHRKISGISI